MVFVGEVVGQPEWDILILFRRFSPHEQWHEFTGLLFRAIPVGLQVEQEVLLRKVAGSWENWTGDLSQTKLQD